MGSPIVEESELKEFIIDVVAEYAVLSIKYEKAMTALSELYEIAIETKKSAMARYIGGVITDNAA